MTRSDTDHTELADHYTDSDTRCAAPGCTELENSAFDDFVRCEACSKSFCDACIVRLADLPFCKGCAACQTCGDLAACLDDNGDLQCAKHADAERDCPDCKGDGGSGHFMEPDRETGYRDEYPCLRCKGRGVIGTPSKAPEPARVIEWPRGDAPCPF